MGRVQGTQKRWSFSNAATGYAETAIGYSEIRYRVRRNDAGYARHQLQGTQDSIQGMQIFEFRGRPDGLYVGVS